MILFARELRKREMRVQGMVCWKSVPAWAIDRLSILAVKIYHMQQEVERKDASPEHVAKCREKLRILLEQRADLSMAITQLLDEIESGKKYMKVYKQMKMYNDPALNPVLYKK